MIQSHPLQSSVWAEFRKAMGVDVAQLNTGYITFHAIAHTPWTIGYFPKGPMPNNRMIEELVKLGRQKNAIFIQLEPNVIRKDETLHQGNNVSLYPSHHPLFTKYTFILDLTKSEDELLKTMHPKTRYNIKIAQKHGVVIQEDNSPEAFLAYLKLSEETTTRQGFFAHNRRYQETMWRILHKAGIAHLFTATYTGETLAAWIIFVWDKTIYYPYGASSRNHREVMAPYLLLWEIARWAKAKHIKRFDLWGAIGPNPDPKNPWYGFHRFKQGFSPELIEFVGSFDLVIRPWMYRVYTVADNLRWFILKYKGKH